MIRTTNNNEDDTAKRVTQESLELGEWEPRRHEKEVKWMGRKERREDFNASKVSVTYELITLDCYYSSTWSRREREAIK